MQSRKKFIVQSSVALAALALLQKNSLAAMPVAKKILGVQLYSVRDDMKSDPLATLKAVSNMGYKYVEHANYVDRKFYGYTAKDFKKLLTSLGMQMKTGHTVLGRNHWDAEKNDFTKEWYNTIEDAAIAGQTHVISPWMDESYRKNADDLKRYMDVFNKCGAICKKQGMKFGYHNHDFEFSQKFDGETVFDIIMQHTDPALVVLQLDTGNMFHAGAKAKDVILKYPGRFETIHVKDEIKLSDEGEFGKYESTILGKGLVPVKEISALAADKGGTKIFIVEQEAYQNVLPLDAIKKDFAIMKSWGY